MGGGEHLAGFDQGAGAEGAEGVVDASDGIPRMAAGFDRGAVVAAVDPWHGQTLDGGGGQCARQERGQE
jgi:hypothetical protein